MNKVIALSMLALSSITAHAAMTVRMNVELQEGETIRTATSECVCNADEEMRISTPAFELAVLAHPVDNEVELAVVIATKNEDDSCTLVAAPVFRTALEKEAVVTLTNEKNDTLNLIVTIEKNSVQEDQEVQ